MIGFLEVAATKMLIRNLSISTISDIREFLAIISIAGLIIACGINLYIFEMWNVSYFQVADLSDIALSAIYAAYIILILLTSLAIIYLFGKILSRDIRFLKISILKIVKQYKYRKYLRIIMNYIYYLLSTFFMILSMIWLMQYEEVQKYPTIFSLEVDKLIFASIFLFILIPYLFSLFHKASYKYFNALAVMLMITYSLSWFIFTASPENFRWYGYFGRKHVSFSMKDSPKCDKLFLLWLGQRNSVIECWRNGRESEQLVFVLNHESGGLIGPIRADPAAQPPYGEYGASPPPFDRMTKEMKDAL